MATENGTGSGNSSSKTLENVLTMSKGGGEDSYSKNSAVQALVVDRFCLPYLDKALNIVNLPAGRTLVVADLGCSSGPNTIGNVSNIVQKLRARYTDAGSPLPEFQALFNDLPSNDFNHLFQLLSSDPRASTLFVGGIPGSFYGRVFPRSSVDVVFSSNSLHWLSKIPASVLDKTSAAYNKDRTWINGSDLATATAYKEQSRSDLRGFLKARAEEIVSGGLLFLVFNGRQDIEPNKQLTSMFGRQRDAAEDVWSKMISEGLITEEQGATFNIPLYFRTPDEVQETLETCSSDFHIDTAKCHEGKVSISDMYGTQDIAKKMATTTKTVINPLMEAYLGKELAEVYWKRCEELYDKDIVPYADKLASDCTIWTHIVSLIRK